MKRAKTIHSRASRGPIPISPASRPIRPTSRCRARPSRTPSPRCATAGAALAMIPIDNSVAGRVADIHHLMPTSGLHIVAEWFLPVQHQLMAPKGASLKTIKTVESHVHALGQCRNIIRGLRHQAGGRRRHRRRRARGSGSRRRHSRGAGHQARGQDLPASKSCSRTSPTPSTIRPASSSWRASRNGRAARSRW